MYTRRFSSWILCAVLATSAATSLPSRAQDAAAASPEALTLTALSKEFICPCPSCGGKALDQCEPQCHDGQERRDAVAGQIKEGKSREQIKEFMAATYGAQVLGEPPREGWGIMSVMMPLACLAAGAIPLMWFTRGRKNTQPQRAGSRRAPSVAPAEDARVAAALKDFDF